MQPGSQAFQYDLLTLLISRSASGSLSTVSLDRHTQVKATWMSPASAPNAFTVSEAEGLAERRLFLASLSETGVFLQGLFQMCETARYCRLVDVGYAKHFRVSHGDSEFASDHSHINGVESFLGVCKTAPQ